jgi:hypothetical protein
VAESIASASIQRPDGINTIELRVEGSHGEITLRRFLGMMGEALAVLRDLDSAIAADPRGSLEWYVTNLHASDLTATIEQRPKPGKMGDHGSLVASTFVRGLDTLQHEATQPPYMSESGLKAIGKLSSNIGVNGATGFRAVAVGAQVSARVDREAGANVRRVLAPRFKARGSVTGKLEMIQVHRGRTFNIYGSRNHRAVRCSFREDLLEDAKAFLGDLVIASGIVHRNARGDALRLDVETIVSLTTASVPRVDQIYGIDPNFTGDQTTAEYLAELRGR